MLWRMRLEAQQREIAGTEADCEVDELALLSQNSLMSNNSEFLPILEDDEAPASARRHRNCISRTLTSDSCGAFSEYGLI